MDILFIDGHEDIAYNVFCFGRDYATSAKEIRIREQNTEIPAIAGQATLGWEDWKNANTAIILSTLFTFSKRYQISALETAAFRDADEARKLLLGQVNIYRKLSGEHPDKFSLITDRKQMLSLWNTAKSGLEHPVGLVMVIEGAEGIKKPEDVPFWWEQGVRAIGPVWSGGKYCGGTKEHGGFTTEGRKFISIMAELGMGLDLSHMTEESALEALDRYEGVVYASHANARALLPGVDSERHFTDLTIRRVAERGGVIGVIPYNLFLIPNWTKNSPRDKVTINHLADQIDHICQLTGSADYASIGSDFDGGFGYPDIPLELNTIADIQILPKILFERGYSEEDVRKIFGENMKSILERILPE